MAGEKNLIFLKQLLAFLQSLVGKLHPSAIFIIDLWVNDAVVCSKVTLSHNLLGKFILLSSCALIQHPYK